jgi:hypothetical protein
MRRHLVYGFEGLFRQVMYVFDDAIVFVAPPPTVMAADALGIAAAKVKAMHGPSFNGEDAITGLAADYVERRKFNEIAEFSRQFGNAGFSDPRITSTMLAEQLGRSTRVPHEDIEGVRFMFRPGGLHPQVVVSFARRGIDPALAFRMRYRIPKARQAHEALASVLGARVLPLSPDLKD